jgi:hypothetical protein
MSVDWKLLAPHKPVELGSPLYVVPPLQTTLADWVLAGSSAILLGGPAGVGKSSDLAHAASLLQAQRVACFVPLDRWENMRALTPEKLALRLAARLVQVATQLLKLPVSAALQDSVGGPFGDLKGFGVKGVDHFVATSRVVLHQAIQEVTRLSRQGRITFLIDGLEKVPPGADSALLFDELGLLPDSVDVVVVVPWHVTFGTRPDAIVRVGERFCPLRAFEVSGVNAFAGQDFLHEIVKRRVGEGAVQMDLLISAGHWSGGLPRTFLQLLSDAASYARLSGGDGPSRNSLESAVLDQQDSFRRLLMPGDTEAIRAAIGTDGRELELTRKVRLMAHGMLLERSRDRTTVLELHPLADDALRGASK